MIGLLVVGTAVGAVLGRANRSTAATPSQQVAAMLAATEKAGSAHVSYRQVTTSTNAALRSALSGHGVVNFAANEARVSQVEHSITFSSTGKEPLHPTPSTGTMEAVVVGATVYQADPIRGFAFTNKYHEISFPKLPRSQRGLALALGASNALFTLQESGPVAALIDLGPTRINGVATTQYEVRFEPVRICAPHKTVQVLLRPPSDVWVDSTNRLVQLRSTNSFDDRIPKGATIPAQLGGLRFPQGRTTTVTTLTFSKFGSPVHIVVPPATALFPDGNSSVGTATEQTGTCRS